MGKSHASQYANFGSLQISTIKAPARELIETIEVLLAES